MNYRLNSKVIALVGVLVLIALGFFIYVLVSAPTKEEVAESDTNPQVEQVIEQIVSGKHQYVDGTHTIAGMVSVPTPCHSVLVEPFFVENGTTTVVELRFTTVLNGDECPAVVSDTSFKVTFEAPEDAEIRALWDGSAVRLSLVPVAPGESLDEEFYFKG